MSADSSKGETGTAGYAGPALWTKEWQTEILSSNRVEPRSISPLYRNNTIWRLFLLAAGSIRLCGESMERTCNMGFIRHIKEEFQVISGNETLPLRRRLEVLLYPSFRVMIQYRQAHKLYEKGHYLSGHGGFPSERPEKQVLKFIRGLQIGKGLFIDHGAGVIIGETTSYRR